MTNLAIIMQGDLRAETPAALRAARALYPGSELILATWAGQAPLPEFDLCDQVLHLADPGPLPTDSPIRNLRRQSLSTQAGLERTTRPWTLKIRSDIILQASHLGSLAAGLRADQLGVWRNFTARPRRGHLLFHPSDILQLGATSMLRAYWPSAVPEEAAHSGLLPEQWLFFNYLAGKEPVAEPWAKNLAGSFADVRLHCRTFARYLHILPRETAALPERLRGHEARGQLDRNHRGSLAESALIYTLLQLREARARGRERQRVSRSARP